MKNKKITILHASLLIFIFLISFYIRAEGIVPDRILSFDPVYQYRFTKYFVQWGFFPDWDELSYYVGRKFYMPPLMYYLTAIIYKILLFAKPMFLLIPIEKIQILFSHMTLKTAASLSAAFYGALIAISAYLLGKELSNKWGGILSAALVSFAPQILVRTFGASYDTDQLVLFFILLTLWSSIRFFKKMNLFNFVLMLFSFTGFMLTWNMFWYTFFIFVGIVGGYYYLLSVEFLFREKRIAESVIILLFPILLLLLVFVSIIGFVFFSLIFVSLILMYIRQNDKIDKKDFNIRIISLIALFVSLIIIGLIEKLAVIKWFFDIIGFARNPEVWIVNISIAELQHIGFNINSLIKSFGGYVFGYYYLDIFTLIFFVFTTFFGVWYLYKKDKKIFTAYSILLLFALITVTRGIRFTEYTSAILLTLFSASFVYLFDFFKKNEFSKNFLIGIFMILLFLSTSLALQYGPNLGPDMDPNWDATWNYLKTKTPELSLVGTWWDPGHMITGFAERRVIADGAHCGFDCMLTINDRITDLGKIFATENENEALYLLRKYQGTSPKVYWIASKDLIQKYQWLQFFGTGCDARTDPNCKLYTLIPQTNAYYSENGEPFLRWYSSVGELEMLNIPIVFYTNGKNAAVFQEIWYYENGTVQQIDLENLNSTELYQMLSPIFYKLGYRLSKSYIPQTVWISEDKSYIAVIPDTLKNTLFTKMFFLDGKGLEKFKLVYKNPEVRLYEVTGLEDYKVNE